MPDLSEFGRPPFTRSDIYSVQRVTWGLSYKDFSVPPIAQPLAHRGDKITPKGYKKNVFFYQSSNLYDVVDQCTVCTLY